MANPTIRRILFTMAFACAVDQAAALAPDINHLSAPNSDWSLGIDLNGTEILESQFSPDGDARMVLVKNKESGLTISVFIEKSDHDGDSKECRKFYWRKAEENPTPRANVLQYEKNDVSFVEYDIKGFQSESFTFHHLNSYRSQSGYWVDVHISKADYDPKDKALFDHLLGSIVIERPKYRNVSELIAYGSQAYYSKDYKMAIHPYESLLESEKEKITLEKTIWYVVVDNLGIAYGETGDLKNSKRVYEYGIKLAPEYPNFYYNMACVYAESSDLDKAIQNLEMAYRNKGKVIAGKKLPNPREDSSFKSYLNDDKFKQFLKKYDL